MFSINVQRVDWLIGDQEDGWTLNGANSLEDLVIAKALRWVGVGECELWMYVRDGICGADDILLVLNDPEDGGARIAANGALEWPDFVPEMVMERVERGGSYEPDFAETLAILEIIVAEANKLVPAHLALREFHERTKTDA